MARTGLQSLALLAVLLLAVGTQAAEKRFEFKHSLRGPFPWYQQNKVLGWKVGGSALVSEKAVRVVPSAQNRIGRIWNEESVQFPDWELRVEFMISGRKLGADGMAIWYTDSLDSGSKAFGGPSTWKGLGIFLDTFDNDNKGDNPSIYAIVNDGNLVFSHKTDGFNQTFARCQANIRNSLAPVNLLVTYKNNNLEIKYDLTRTRNWVSCCSLQNVNLPQGYHFAVTAATGALADDHDLLAFEVYNVSPAKFSIKIDVPAEGKEGLTSEELREIEEDFNRQQAALDKDRQTYQQTHAEELQRHEWEDEGVGGRAVLDLTDLLEMQIHLSSQVDSSFTLANQRLEHLMKNFQKQLEEVTNVQPQREDSAFNLLPTINDMLTQITSLDSALSEAETRLQWEQLVAQEEIKKAVRDDIGNLGTSVVNDTPWSSILLFLIAGQAIFFVIYLIWKRKVDQEKKFI